jgi:hypothetical protein
MPCNKVSTTNRRNTQTRFAVSYFKRELVFLHKDADGIAHEVLSDVVYFAGHGSGEQAHLHLLRHKLEYIINLVFEAAREHLVGLVQHEHLDVRDAESAAVDLIVNTAGGADDNVDAFLQLADVVSHVGASDAGVALRLHEVAEPVDDFLDLIGMLATGC